jgi:hypothetical protein
MLRIEYLEKKPGGTGKDRYRTAIIPIRRNHEYRDLVGGNIGNEIQEPAPALTDSESCQHQGNTIQSSDAYGPYTPCAPIQIPHSAPDWKQSSPHLMIHNPGSSMIGITVIRPRTRRATATHPQSLDDGRDNGRGEMHRTCSRCSLPVQRLALIILIIIIGKQPA